MSLLNGQSVEGTFTFASPTKMLGDVSPRPPIIAAPGFEHSSSTGVVFYTEVVLKYSQEQYCVRVKLTCWATFWTSSNIYKSLFTENMASPSEQVTVVINYI